MQPQKVACLAWTTVQNISSINLNFFFFGGGGGGGNKITKLSFFIPVAYKNCPFLWFSNNKCSACVKKETWLGMSLAINLVSEQAKITLKSVTFAQTSERENITIQESYKSTGERRNLFSSNSNTFIGHQNIWIHFPLSFPFFLLPPFLPPPFYLRPI